MYLHFGHIHSEMGKENKIAFRNYIIYLNIYNKPPLPHKRMKSDENENLAFNNEMRMNEMKTKPSI